MTNLFEANLKHTVACMVFSKNVCSNYFQTFLMHNGTVIGTRITWKKTPL